MFFSTIHSRGPRSLESLGTRGTVLVFLPGLPEIKGMDAVLNQLLFNSQYVYSNILTVHTYLVIHSL